MHWPQIAMIVWISLMVGVGMAEHGRPQTGTESVWTSIVAAALLLFILIKGGFFK